MSFIVTAKQLGDRTIRVFYDDGKVEHLPGIMEDYTSKAVITKCSDGMTLVYYSDGKVQHYQ